MIYKNELLFWLKAVILIYIFHCPQTSFAQWIETNEGLNGGQIRAFLSYENNLFVGTDGGIFLSNNNGRIWNRRNAGLDYYSVNSIVKNNDVLFAAINGGSLMFTSKDNALNWEIANNGLQAGIVKLVSLSGGVIGLSNIGTLYKTTNEGESWSEFTTPLGQILSIEKSSNQLLVGTNDGIYSSSDLGLTWTKKDNGLANTRVFGISASEDNVIIRTSGGVFFSKNNGDLWRRLSVLPDDSYSLASSGVFLIAANSRGIYRSEDGGDSWRFINSPDGTFSFLIASHADLFVLGTNTGLFTSSDTGMNWELNNEGIKNAFVYKFYRTSNNHIFIGTISGIYRSENNGQSWQKVNIGLEASSVGFSAAENILFASIDNSGTFRSADQGNTWQRISNTLLIRITTSPDGTWFASGPDGEGIYVSNDQGINWTRNSSFSSIFDLIFYKSRLYCCTYNNGVAFSIDKGVSWVYSNNGINLNGIYPNKLTVFKDRLLIGTANGGVFMLDENMSTWESVNVGLTNLGEVTEFVSNDSTLFLACNRGVFSTTNPSISWVAQNDGFPIELMDVESLFVDNSKFLAGTRSLGVWYWQCAKPLQPVITVEEISPSNYLLTSSSDVGNQWYFNNVPIEGATGKEYKPLLEGRYSLRVTINNCESDMSDYYYITITANPFIEMPNVITPNGDGFNEKFLPISFDGIQKADIKLYNRWGDLIYSSDDLFEGWDGNNQPASVYFYLINFEDINGLSRKLKGWVKLIRQ